MYVFPRTLGGRQSTPDALIPNYFLQLLLGDLEAFPGRMRYIISSACSSQLEVPGIPQSEASKGHPNQMLEPPELTPSNAKEQQFYFKVLLDIGAHHPAPKDGHAQFLKF